MEHALVAPVARGRDAHPLHRLVPVVRRGHGAVVRPEADDVRGVAEERATQLADVVLSRERSSRSPRRRRRASCAPTRSPWTPARRTPERLQRVEHVRVAQVPGRRRAIVHRAVVALGVRDEARVLGRVEEPLAVLSRVVDALLRACRAASRRRRLGALVAPDEHGLSVRGRVLLPWGQRSVALARDPRGAGSTSSRYASTAAMDVNRLYRSSPWKPALCSRMVGVVRTQPVDEVVHLLVAPHPRRKSRERRELEPGAAARHRGRSRRRGRRRASRPRRRRTGSRAAR